ncbi:MAG: ribosome biogenesis GTP-binding protein YihA/YsxC [Bdellovibrionales bacterium]|nr:ribosome biogenesis GTP-binding protein YihA/YsxC [Bdellovibrionales bacterium]
MHSYSALLVAVIGKTRSSQVHSRNMAGEWIATVGNADQLKTLIQGPFLKGHREPRLAMVGRSNVGKSSLINSLIGTRLAQVSAEPGKTRLIHFYTWKEASRIIVDLPGYGYAKVSQADRKKWAELIQAYLRSDENLEVALLLVDSRHGPSPLDREAYDFLSSGGVPVQVVFTKLDGLKTQKERAQRRREADIVLKEMGVDPSSALWVSSRSGDRMNELVNLIRAPSMEGK